jgi:hypothetical protein
MSDDEPTPGLTCEKCGLPFAHYNQRTVYHSEITMHHALVINEPN